MTLFSPLWLLLLVPVGISLWIWRLPSRPLRVLRLVIILLILLAMCRPAVRLSSRAGIIVVIADRSQSMPPGSEIAQKEAIDLIQATLPSAGPANPSPLLAVVSFGQASVVEQPPQRGKFTGFVNEVEGDGSSLAEAIETALSLIPLDIPGRILLLSDGRWTGKDPISVASQAVVRGIAIDYRLIQRTSANDLAISQIDAPFTATPGESFMITAWIRSPYQQEISFELLRVEISGIKSQRLASGVRKVSSGLSRLTFRDHAAEPGTYQYTLRVYNPSTQTTPLKSEIQEDPIPENNTAKILVGIQGPRPILHVAAAKDNQSVTSTSSGLVRLLEAGGIKVKTVTPDEIHWSLEDLSNFSAVLIENVPAEKIGIRGMENIAAWVKETGAGFMMTGGKNAYGPGGYFRSPLEPIMPVSMELRHEHRKLALAIVVALDRSGSMAMSVSGNRTKMDLANLAAVQVLDLLSSIDEFGVVAVDSTAHVVADLAPVENNARVRGDILQINTGGGGIFIYEALSAAMHMLLPAKAGTRHIILFADASDSEEPGKYQELLEKGRQANITVSVVGLGKPTDQDAELLRDIARRGGGRSFFTDNPEELPRLFAQDTFVVARSTFLDRLTPIQFTSGFTAMTGKQFEEENPQTVRATNWLPLQIGGYNLCYLRPNANLAAITVDEYRAPIVAAWQAGTGRVLSYTGEVDGVYTGPIAQWKGVGDFLTSMVRWVAGDSKNLPGNMLVTQDIKNGIYEVQLHLDPESIINDRLPIINNLPVVTTLRGVPDTKPTVQKTRMHWTSTDMLSVEIPLQSKETILATVEVAGIQPFSLSPVTLPYSPEFKPVESIDGPLTLERLAQATGGTERIDLAGIWNDLPRQPRMIEIGSWLLILASILLLLEVLERRTGLLSIGKQVMINFRYKGKVSPSLPGEQIAIKSQKSTKGEEDLLISPKQKTDSRKQFIGEKKVEVADQPLADQVEKTGISDALRQARRQARERTKRN